MALGVGELSRDDRAVGLTLGEHDPEDRAKCQGVIEAIEVSSTLIKIKLQGDLLTIACRPLGHVDELHRGERIRVAIDDAREPLWVNRALKLDIDRAVKPKAIEVGASVVQIVRQDVKARFGSSRSTYPSGPRSGRWVAVNLQIEARKGAMPEATAS